MKNKDRFAALEARIDKFQAEVSTEIARLQGTAALLVQAAKHSEETVKRIEEAVKTKPGAENGKPYNDQAGFEARIGPGRRQRVTTIKEDEGHETNGEARQG